MKSPLTTPPTFAARWALVLAVACVLALCAATRLRAQTLYPSVTFNGNTNALVRPTAAQFRSANGLAIGTDVQAYDADLTSWAAITRATGFDTFTATPSGANLASLLTTALPASKGGTGLTSLSANVVSLLGAADYSAMRTQLSLVPGTDVQAYDADLASIAANTTGGFLTRTASNTYTARTITGTAGQITVTNGDGVSGAPTISLPSTITQATTFSQALTTQGNFTFGTSGSVLNGTTGSIGLTATGTNQSITFTPTGTGAARVVVTGTSSSDNDVLNLRVSQNGAGTGVALNFVPESGAESKLAQIIARRTSVANGYTDIDFTSWNGTGAESRMKLVGGATGAGGLAIYPTTTSTSTITGALTVAGGLGVAGRTSTATLNTGGTNGSTIDLVASATGTLDFGSISAASSADLTITVTGASTGDSVHLGLPASPTAGIIFNAFVSASNTVTVRAFNITAGAIDPASATYRVTVISF